MKNHFVLEADGRTPKPATYEEWRTWKFKNYASNWRTEVKGWNVSTRFVGTPESPRWGTAIVPAGSSHVIVRDFKWNTYEEAETGHKDVVKKIEEGTYLSDG